MLFVADYLVMLAKHNRSGIIQDIHNDMTERGGDCRYLSEPVHDGDNYRVPLTGLSNWPARVFVVNLSNRQPKRICLAYLTENNGKNHWF